VTTIVTKLFAIAGECSAYFGRKDAQQLAVVRRMAADLDLPVTVVGCPIVREPDGLAMSSRNAYLSTDDRARATVLVRSLRAASEAVLSGERDAAELRHVLAATFATEPAVRIDYAEVVDALDLQPVERIERDTLVAVAAFVGTTRLIDNVTISVSTTEDGTSCTVDEGLLTAGK
jgi:pantoate--beta-alanine ligase